MLLGEDESECAAAASVGSKRPSHDSTSGASPLQGGGTAASGLSVLNCSRDSLNERGSRDVGAEPRYRSVPGTDMIKGEADEADAAPDAVESSYSSAAALHAASAETGKRLSMACPPSARNRMSTVGLPSPRRTQGSISFSAMRQSLAPVDEQGKGRGSDASNWAGGEPRPSAGSNGARLSASGHSQTPRVSIERKPWRER